MKKKLRIALVHDHLDQFGGGEAVLKALHELYPEAPIFTLVYDKKKAASILPDANIQSSFIQKLVGGLKHFKWYLPFMPAAFEAFDLSDYDIVLSDSSAFSKCVITSPGTLHVDYCHTPTRYLWTDHYSYVRDLSYNNYLKGFIQLATSYLRVVDKTAVDRVDAFIANSQYVSKRIAKYYKRESAVIYPPVRTTGYDIVPKEKLGDYFLIVSRLRPYKKVDLAVSASNRTGIPLKIIGGGEEGKRLRKVANGNIEFLGEVDDTTRDYYLRHCQAFLHPQEEDFGISAIEAMAAGRPVIAYGAGGALETIIDGKTGMFFDEQTWEAMADKMIRFRDMEFDPKFIQRHAATFDVALFKEKINKFIMDAWEMKVGKL